jgi:hypothetical protein
VAAKQDELTRKAGPAPSREPRSVIKDVTPEKVAEILSRGPSGSLMVHDELAGFIGSFERYTNGASASAFYLQCWIGGPFTKTVWVKEGAIQTRKSA